jgi:hypothetical protein
VFASDDLTGNPAGLVLARTTGSCLDSGCDPRDPGPRDPCALGTAACSPFATCTSSAPDQSTCTCSDGNGDGYTCTPPIAEQQLPGMTGTLRFSQAITDQGFYQVIFIPTASPQEPISVYLNPEHQYPALAVHFPAGATWQEVLDELDFTWSQSYGGTIGTLSNPADGDAAVAITENLVITLPGAPPRVAAALIALPGMNGHLVIDTDPWNLGGIGTLTLSPDLPADGVLYVEESPDPVVHFGPASTYQDIVDSINGWWSGGIASGNIAWLDDARDGELINTVVSTSVWSIRP